MFTIYRLFNWQNRYSMQPIYVHIVSIAWLLLATLYSKAPTKNSLYTTLYFYVSLILSLTVWECFCGHISTLSDMDAVSDSSKQSYAVKASDIHRKVIQGKLHTINSASWSLSPDICCVIIDNCKQQQVNSV